MRRHQFFYINKHLKFSDKIKATLIKWSYDYINYIIIILKYILWPKKLNFSANNICIFVIGNIGDILCSIPSIISIRKAYPNSHLTLLTSPEKKGYLGAKELLSGSDYIDDMIVYFNDDIKNIKGLIHLIKIIRKNKFDELIYLSKEKESLIHILKIMLFSKVCGCKNAYGFWISFINKFTSLQSRTMFFIDEVDRYRKTLSEYGVPIAENIEYSLPILIEHRKKTKELIEKYNLDTRPLFAFVPGAKREENKWPASYFNLLGILLTKEFPTSKIIILGGPDVKDSIIECISTNICAESIIDLTGKISLLETASMLKNIDVVISNNTGIMHMAALLGIKVIGIFSSTEFFGKWYPHSQKARVLIKDIPCKGCYYNCTNNYECISSISPEEVFFNIKEILFS